MDRTELLQQHYDDLYRNSDITLSNTGILLFIHLVLDLFRERTGKLMPERILDIGCGKGQYAAAWQEVTGAKVIAADISPVAIDYAKEYYSDRVDFACIDCSQITGSYDLIFAKGFMPWVERAWCNYEVHAIIRNWYEHLEATGMIFTMIRHKRLFEMTYQQMINRFTCGLNDELFTLHGHKGIALVPLMKETWPPPAKGGIAMVYTKR